MPEGSPALCQFSSENRLYVICALLIAGGLVTRQPFTALDPTGCSTRVAPPDDRRSA